MDRISESAAIVIVVAVLFLGLQYTASMAPLRSQDNASKAIVPDVPAYTNGTDEIPPETVATVDGQKGLDNWYQSPVSLSLMATDNGTGVSETEYSLDNYVWTIYEQTLNMSSEGIATIYYRSRDLAGNAEAAKSITIQIDMAAPQTKLTLAGSVGLEGWYSTTVGVTLVPFEAVSGVAYTNYSLDGGDWTTYIEPFTISEDGPHELSFMSVDVAGNVESSQTTYLKIDKNAPTTIPSLGGTSGLLDWYASDVTLTLAASDGASGVKDTAYNVDGIGWSSYGDAIVISGEGVHTVQFWSADVAGNTEDTKTVLVKIDMTPPSTSALVQGSQLLTGWYISNVVVVLSGMDGISDISYSEYSIDGGPWTVYREPFMITGSGSHEVAFRSVDLAGNIENSQLVTMDIDRTPPTTSALLGGTLGLNGWYTSAVTVTLVASDDGSGVADTEYSRDKTSWTSYDKPFTFYDDGVYTIYFYSTDNAFNGEEWRNVTIFIDKTPPVTIAGLNGTAGQNGWYVSNVNITLTPFDSRSGIFRVTYSLDGLTWNDYMQSFIIQEEGIWNLAFYAYDNAGNREPSESITVCVDKSPPTTSASVQGNVGLNGWYVSEVTIAFSATDMISYTLYTEYALDDTNWVMYSEPIVVRIDGMTVLHYRSMDYAGNMETPSQLDIPIDTTPPTTIAAFQGELGNQGWYVSELNVTLFVMDTASGSALAYYSFDNSTWYPFFATFNLSSEGNLKLYCYSIDMAGNVEQVVTIEANIDMTPPTTEINTESYYSSGMITLVANDLLSGVARTYYRIDGVNWIVYTGPFEFSVAAGFNVIEYYSIDNAGNEEWPKSTTFTLTEVEVTSFVSYCPYPWCKYTELDSLDVYFVYNRRTGYVLTTGTWLLWYDIEVKNELSEVIPTLDISPTLPSDFTMRGLTVWLVLSSGQQLLLYVHMNSTCGGQVDLYPKFYDGMTVCFNGQTVTVTNTPSGARVFVSVAMEYDLSRTIWKSPGDFNIASYTFTTVVEAIGTYYSVYTLPVETHVVKRCWC